MKDGWVLDKRKATILATISGLSLVFDLGTKKLVQATMALYDSIPLLGHWLRLTFVYNEGMAFGLNPQEAFPNLPIRHIHTGLVLVALALLLGYYVMTRDERTMNLAGLALIIGGAMGNLVDRVSMGRVVDFVDMGLSEALRWPVYNVADSCVTIGIVLLAYLSFLKQAPLPVPKPFRDGPEEL